MRAYFWVNSWLSGRQKGIQAAHCVAEMSMLDPDPKPSTQKEVFEDWAADHKTIIMLEGGRHADLHRIESFCRGKLVTSMPEGGYQIEDIKAEPYPWASFSEDEESLNGAMTCVGIIIPERIYETASLVRESGINLGLGLDDEKVDSVVGHADLIYWEIELIKLINSCKLAGE